MGGALFRIFGLSESEEADVAKTVGRVKTIAEYSGDLVEAARKTGFVDAIKSSAPWWCGPLVEAVGDAVPPVKFLVKLLEKLPGKPSPEALGLLACTLAYQRAAEQALLLTGPPANSVPLNDSVADAKNSLKRLEFTDTALMKGFSLTHPAAHPFVWHADVALRTAMAQAGYTDLEFRRFQRQVHAAFKEQLRLVLAAAELKDKFDSFTRWAQLGTEEDKAYHALQAHADEQRRRFEEEPVLGREPFSLADVYTEVDCGILAWKQIRKTEQRLDPFDEKNGGRQSLLRTVLDYVANPQFNDAIVLQGGPGAGKSAFCSKLSVELLRQGFCPLLIRFRDLDINAPILDALAKAVTECEQIDIDSPPAPKPDHALLGGKVFEDWTQIGKTRISPYVLILDGWDEVSTAEEGFQIQVSRVLQAVRREFLGRRDPLVRVIVTGRPTDALEAANFLADNTPVLTVRPFTPEQLDKYMHRLHDALQRAPATLDRADIERWSLGDLERFRPVLDEYAKEHKQQAEGPAKASLEVLGQPLLAYLAFRVMAEFGSEQELAEIIASPTRLYRSLVDLTCGKAGKAAYDTGDSMHQSRLRGLELRRMLHRTAAAITALGVESISFRELTLRARLRDEERQELVDKSKRDRPWTRLMISFYFKGGGEHHGCEFLHKGFREYLFAEGIVETIKDYARRQRGEVERRSRYWEDFPRREEMEGDQRWALSRALGELVSPNWLTPEVAAHVERLIAWEVSRSDAPPASTLPREEIEPLPIEGWETACDLLAELWEWWGEGVHLRPQPRRDYATGELKLDPPYVDELVNLAMTRDRREERPIPAPIRTTTVDAHLGDALFRLAALLHYHVALKRGWDFNWRGVQVEQGRKYQVLCHAGGREFRAFAPSGDNNQFMRFYAARINAAGWRWFTVRLPMMGVYLRSCYLPATHFAWTRLDGADLSGSILSHAHFVEVSLTGSDLTGASLYGTDLRECTGLTTESLKSAGTDQDTKLPAELAAPRPPTPSPPPVP